MKQRTCKAQYWDGAFDGCFADSPQATRDQSLIVRHVTCGMCPIPIVFLRKLTALLTVFLFTFSMAISPVFAEVVTVKGGTIDINTQDNVTNWNVTGNPVWNMPEFNVARGSTYNIAGLGSGASLALLVNGGAASNIFGTMNLSNLDFILQNIAGINIGASALINVNNASLIASALPLNLSATDFFNRQYAFEGKGGFLMNEGRIVGSNADLVALVGNAIENRGVIEVPMGTVALAAGDTVAVGISPDGLVTIGIDPATANTLGLADQIKNRGTISAQGGRVVLSAKAIDGLFDKAIHIEKNANTIIAVQADNGSIEFQSMDDIYNSAIIEAMNGQIKINSTTGDVTNAGTLRAKNGSVEIATAGDVETTGVLEAKVLRESAASFGIGGVYKVGQSFHDNLDNAITFAANTTLEGDEDEGAIDGMISDDENIIINAGVILTLASDFTLAADADANGTGNIQMAQTAEIVGAGYNLTLKGSGTSTLGKIAGINHLVLAKQTDAGATYRVLNAVTMNGNLTVNSGVTLTGGYSVTVGGGSVTGDGTINMTGGVFTVVGPGGDAIGQFGGNTDWTFWKLLFGDGIAAGVTQKAGPNKVTVLTDLNISLGHELKAGSSNWDLSWGGGLPCGRCPNCRRLFAYPCPSLQRNRDVVGK